MEIDKKRCGLPKKIVVATDADGNVVTEYPSIKAVGRALNLNPSTIHYRIRTGKYYNGVAYSFKSQNDYTPYTMMMEEEVSSYPSEAFNGQYKIIAYHTRQERICITPCPYKEGIRKTMVGSLQCEACRSFRGKKRNEHIIACDFRRW